MWISTAPVVMAEFTLGRIAFDDVTRHADDGFARQGRGFGSEGIVGAGDELGDTRLVTQIDEEHASMVTRAVHEAGEAHTAAGVLTAQLAAEVGTMCMIEKSRWGRCGEYHRRLKKQRPAAAFRDGSWAL